MLDIFSFESYGVFNIKLSQIFGLNTAVYCSELINILKKAKNKEKMIEGEYFKVDRTYITRRTSLSVENQLTADANLIKVNVIKKHKDNPDILKLDVILLASIIASEDIKLLEEIKSRTKTDRPKGVRASARERTINDLKDSFTCKNYELLGALRDWVDAIYAKPGGYLSRAAVRIFEETLNSYSQRDLDLALRLVKIAITQGYKDCQWAINVYEKDLALAKKNKKTQILSPSAPARAESDKLSDEVF